MARIFRCMGPGGRGILFSIVLASGACGHDSRSLVALDGSSTVYPIAEAISEEYQSEHGDVMVTVGRSGTGGGFNRFCRGDTDLSAASRPIRPQEAARCAGAGIEFVEIPVALDGLSVIVSRTNDFVDCLSVQELRSIWRSGSRVRTWRDVRPEFPGHEIHLFGPGTESGTYDTFTEAIVGEAGASRTDFQASEDDNVLVQGISGDPYALGFFGFAYFDGNREKLEAVAVDGGSGCVHPSPATIQAGLYAPLTRPLYIYVRRRSLQESGVRSFLSYFMNHAAELIPETGFVPLADSLYQANLRLLSRYAGVPLVSGGGEARTGGDGG